MSNYLKTNSTPNSLKNHPKSSKLAQKSSHITPGRDSPLTKQSRAAWPTVKGSASELLLIVLENKSAAARFAAREVGQTEYVPYPSVYHAALLPAPYSFQKPSTSTFHPVPYTRSCLMVLIYLKAAKKKLLV